ncbi:MAG: hypothetical protein KBD90_00375 [Alphaproteobacteria bacterium]|nr:hypothetical protein [Alphaproteobacteria bacterium]
MDDLRERNDVKTHGYHAYPHRITASLKRKRSYERIAHKPSNDANTFSFFARDFAVDFLPTRSTSIFSIKTMALNRKLCDIAAPSFYFAIKEEPLQRLLVKFFGGIFVGPFNNLIKIEA